MPCRYLAVLQAVAPRAALDNVAMPPPPPSSATTLQSDAWTFAEDAILEQVGVGPTLLYSKPLVINGGFFLPIYIDSRRLPTSRKVTPTDGQKLHRCFLIEAQTRYEYTKYFSFLWGFLCIRFTCLHAEINSMTHETLAFCHLFVLSLPRKLWICISIKG